MSYDLLASTILFSYLKKNSRNIYLFTHEGAFENILSKVILYMVWWSFEIEFLLKRN